VRRDWRVLIPVKPLAEAKTRIDLDPQTRADLVLAMCRDVVAAATSAPNVDRVQVISTDPRVAAAVLPLGADLWQAPGVTGLNAELEAALTAVPEDRGVAMLMADLPCLTSGLVAEILDTAPTSRASFVPDLADQGTTMLLQPPNVRVAPRFGRRSATAHGTVATPMTSDRSWWGARRDIDTLQDLEFAAQLDPGPYTEAFLGRPATLMSAATLSGNRVEVFAARL
jgi:2-phospho-L-lactate/phosphoenolpyruvate guanylyltransferase